MVLKNPAELNFGTNPALSDKRLNSQTLNSDRPNLKNENLINLKDYLSNEKLSINIE